MNRLLVVYIAAVGAGFILGVSTGKYLENKRQDDKKKEVLDKLVNDAFDQYLDMVRKHRRGGGIQKMN